jgi:hypothetical protein
MTPEYLGSGASTITDLPPAPHPGGFLTGAVDQCGTNHLPCPIVKAREIPQ